MNPAPSSEALDSAIRGKYEELTFAATRGKLAHWETHPLGLAALVVILDQFPRRWNPALYLSYPLSLHVLFFHFLTLHLANNLRLANNNENPCVLSRSLGTVCGATLRPCFATTISSARSSPGRCRAALSPSCHQCIASSYAAPSLTRFQLLRVVVVVVVAAAAVVVVVVYVISA